MAAFSRKVVLLFLMALVLLSIAVRYPLVEHERFQTDSYTVHLYAKSIADSGYAVWAFHPLSYFGYYPLSYPSGVPFLIAEVSELTGASIELSILLVDNALAIAFCLGAFVLCRQFLSRPEYVLAATFFAAMGARFVDTTYWDGSARGPMVVLVTFVAFTAFRSSQMGQRRLLVFAGLLTIGCFATHHMAILLVLFGVAYLLASFQVQYLFPRFRRRKSFAAALWNVAIVLAVTLTAFTVFDYFGDLALMNLRRSSVFDLEPAIASIVLNLGISYSNQIGIILIPALLAIPSIFRRDYISTESLFLVTLPVAFIPMLGSSLYVSMILAPFVACLGTIWVARAVRSKRRKIVILLIAALLVATLMTPVWSSSRWNSRPYPSGDMVEVDSRAYSDSIYLRWTYPGEQAICNVNTLWIQLAVNSETRFLAGGVPAAINGDVTSADIKRNVTWSDEPFPSNLYMWFEFEDEPDVDSYVQQLVILGVRTTSNQTTTLEVYEYFAMHPNIIVAVDNNRPDVYVGVYVTQNGLLMPQLEAAKWTLGGGTGTNYREFGSYSIYQSGRVTLYAVQLDV